MDGPAGRPTDNPPNPDRVGGLPSNHTGVDSLVLLTSRNADFATVRFGPRPGPEVMVRNRC